MAINQLDDRARLAVTLFAHGHTCAGIGQQMGLSERQSRYAVQRGLERLRVVIGDSPRAHVARPHPDRLADAV